MTDAATPAPRTAAGRALLDVIGTWGPADSAATREFLVEGFIEGIEREAQQQEREWQVSVRADWGTMSHGKFHEKYGRLGQDLHLLPTNCTCRECRMWSD